MIGEVTMGSERPSTAVEVAHERLLSIVDAHVGL